MAKPPRLPGVPAILVPLLLLTPTAAAGGLSQFVTFGHPSHCVTASAGPEHAEARVDGACLGLPLPNVLGGGSSCRDGRDPDGKPCCEGACCEGETCCKEPCCTDPATCCQDPSRCCEDPSCCKDASCCDTGSSSCCNHPSCCTDPMCHARVAVQEARYRIGHQTGAFGICLDVGQDASGRPYARANLTRSCTAPP